MNKGFINREMFFYAIFFILYLIFFCTSWFIISFIVDNLTLVVAMGVAFPLSIIATMLRADKYLSWHVFTNKPSYCLENTQ